MKKSLFIFVLLVQSVFTMNSAIADESFPGKTYRPGPDPIASRDAEIGGEISIYAHEYPKSFNY
jgi:microcin C transport system substrate-binding protein